MTMKKIAVRVLLVWFFLGQMLCVCLPARTTRPLSRLEALYAFRPSPGNKAALENEFDRVADYESTRAIGRFALILAADVGVLLLGLTLWKIRKPAQKEFAVRSSLLPVPAGS